MVWSGRGFRISYFCLRTREGADPSLLLLLLLCITCQSCTTTEHMLGPCIAAAAAAAAAAGGATAAAYLAPYSGRPDARSGLVAAAAVYLGPCSGRSNTRSCLVAASWSQLLLFFARNSRCKRHPDHAMSSSLALLLSLYTLPVVYGDRTDARAS